MTANQLRQKYLDFFKDKGHTIISSVSLLPENDSSTLFTSSGMQSMIPYLLGEEHPAGTRIANSQRCFRASDIDDVGDNSHTTFFEMLGNWSLGDYFKTEQINWMFDFLTTELSLDPQRLYISVYQGNDKFNIPKDEESALLWKKRFEEKGVEANIVSGHEDCHQGRIFYFDEHENWWSRSGLPENMPIGEIGGFDSEIFWDLGADLKIHEHSNYRDRVCNPSCPCGRFVEIGNNVFMQYLKTADGFKQLEKKNIDFGGGLERMSMAVNDTQDIYETDIFVNLRKVIEDLSGKKYGESLEITKAFRVIMDHLRGASFLVADGAIPSNKDQGYFTRRLIRRAVRFAHHLGIETNFITKIAKVVINDYQEHYPYLKDREGVILQELDKEEDKFRRTLIQGEKEFKKWFDKHAKDFDIVPGKVAFNLLQSYGYPLEMTIEMAKEAGKKVDVDSFKRELKKHQDLSRTATVGKFKGGLADSSEQTIKLHTAAHLLLAALRKVLGDHVSQRGSNITAERLRFDFSHSQKMSEEEIKKVEDLVNDIIRQSLDVSYTEMSISEARDRGAMGVFDSKYGEKVRVYTIANNPVFSKEICAGPHVKNTGVLGRFKIIKESSSSAGVRRIKAVLLDG